MHYHNNMHQRFKLCCYHPNSNTYIHACIYTHVNTYSTQHSHTLDVYLHYCCCWHQLTSVFFKKLRSLYEGINRHPTLCHQSCAHNLKREREREMERERERERRGEGRKVGNSEYKILRTQRSHVEGVRGAPFTVLGRDTQPVHNSSITHTQPSRLTLVSLFTPALPRSATYCGNTQHIRCTVCKSPPNRRAH